jgi:predicted transcriptional regulator
LLDAIAASNVMEELTMSETAEITLSLVAEIVSSYVSNNSLPASDLPTLISSVHGALSRANDGPQEVPVETLVPAIAIKKSVTPEYIICLEDGKKFKSLRRHLRTKYNLSPEDYRTRWNLPADYPMVAPSYALIRSNLAKQIGLGQKRKTAGKPAGSAKPRRHKTVGQ